MEKKQIETFKRKTKWKYHKGGDRYSEVYLNYITGKYADEVVENNYMKLFSSDDWYSIDSTHENNISIYRNDLT